MPGESERSAALTLHVEQALRDAAAAVEQDADELAARVTELLVREVPEYPTDPQTRADMRRATRSGLFNFLRAWRGGEPLDQIEPAPEFMAAARGFARSGAPLQTLLRFGHLTQGVALDAWEQHLAASGLTGAELAAAIHRTQQLSFKATDIVLRRIGEEYERERQRSMRGTEARRAKTIRSVIAGETVDVDAVSRAISYELKRYHVGMVLWTMLGEHEDSAQPRLEATAVALASSIAVKRPLVLPIGSGLAWAWASTADPPRADMLEHVARESCGDGVSVALGEPSFGLVGFRLAHRQATDAAKIAQLARCELGSVTRYGDVELVALLAQDLERAQHFVARQLGPLATDSEEYARLRATLHIYLEEKASRVATARRLGVHANTVSNRVRACGELLRLDLDDPQVDLLVALSLVATVGHAVLPTDGR